MNPQRALKFKPHSLVLNRKSGLAYKILNNVDPCNIHLAASGEPAYMYLRFPDLDGQVFVQSMDEVEKQFALFIGDEAWLEKVDGRVDKAEIIEIPPSDFDPGGLV